MQAVAWLKLNFEVPMSTEEIKQAVATERAEQEKAKAEKAKKQKDDSPTAGAQFFEQLKIDFEDNHLGDAR
ncbi:MAG: hypothetical protein AB7D51_14320, partial [Desulfovibrionaceae bacterium]